MRIIDKLYDYYDYLQDHTDTLVFDRRNSYVVTKEDILCTLDTRCGRKDNLLLLQCGATYWLFRVNMTKFAKTPDHGLPRPLDYDMELLISWKDYDHGIELLKFDRIDNVRWRSFLWQHRNIIFDRIRTKNEDLRDAIIHRDFEFVENYNEHYNPEKHEKEKSLYPVLKQCGIASLIDPETLFYAIDEYFSLKKTESERTVAEGTTNTDKIINHGFDTKSSFRGKLKP